MILVDRGCSDYGELEEAGDKDDHTGRDRYGARRRRLLHLDRPGASLTDTVRALNESLGPFPSPEGLLSMADWTLRVFLKFGYVGSVRGRPKPANTPRSTNHVIAEIRSPSSVSTINPYERAIGARASGT